MANSAGIPTRDLGSFVRFLEEKGELIRITEPVDPHLEVTEIADRFVKAGDNPALLFENPAPGRYSAEKGRTEQATGPDGKLHEYAVVRTVGHHYKQRYETVLADGRRGRGGPAGESAGCHFPLLPEGRRLGRRGGHLPL